jgi:hypothetical protein
MKVYVVIGNGRINDDQHSDPERQVIEIFDSKEKANKYVKEQGPYEPIFGVDYYDDYWYDVEEYEVK